MGIDLVKRGRIKNSNKVNTRSTNLYSHLLIKVSSKVNAFFYRVFLPIVIQILKEENWLGILLDRAEKTRRVENEQTTIVNLEDRYAFEETG